VTQPSVFSDLGAAAFTGAALAALPEALGDSLHLSGLISEQNAHRLKVATNVALVVATGSLMGAGTAWATTTGLQYLGISEPKARIAANTISFLVNTGLSITPTRMALTAVNYGAAALGLFTEKKVMGWMFQSRQS
jgi:hypothetical protein